MQDKIKTIIDGNPIPVLWLDTGFMWSKASDIKFWQQLTKLVIDKKIIVVDTGQIAEILERFKNSSDYNDESKLMISIYKDLVGPYFSIDHRSVAERQIKIAMIAYGKNQPEAVYSFDLLFDELLTMLTPFFDMLNKLSGGSWGTARAFKSQVQHSLYPDWQKIREKAKNEKQGFEERLQQELLARYDIVKKGDTDDANYYEKKWEQVAGDDKNGLLNFFSSDTYKQIPYVYIYSHLVSDLIVGNEPLTKPSDYFDVNILSSIIPFANYIVVDNSMRNRIERLKLTEAYSCKVLKGKELEDILKSLE